jgi:transitional endoplasmic reticulum ATPase
MMGFGQIQKLFILHEGPEEPSRSLLLAVGVWHDALHNEIFVFNQGYWQKDAALYREIQKADWNDIILDETFKSALQKDVDGFFTSESVYHELSIPWKVSFQ